MKNSLKKCAAIAAVLLSSQFIFAEFVPLPKEGAEARNSVEFSFAHSAENKGIERNMNFQAAKYRFILEPFSLFAGYQTGKFTDDLTFEAVWLPLRRFRELGIMDMGLSLLYHYQNYTSVYIEHDLILSGRIFWKSNENFSFCFDVGYVEKIADIFELPNLIHNHEIGVSLKFDKIWSNNLETFASIGSHDEFRYPLFFAPRFKIGVAYNFARFRPAFELEAGFTDFFAAVVYCDSLRYRFSGRIMF